MDVAAVACLARDKNMGQCKLTSQQPFITEGKDMADELAKKDEGAE